MSKELQDGSNDPRIEAEIGFSAVEEGYEPFYQELLNELGRFSVENAETLDEQERKDIASGNLEFLKNFSKLLPHYSAVPDTTLPNNSFLTWGFDIPQGPNAQYLYRQIQAQTVWGKGLRIQLPHFVIGKSAFKDQRVLTRSEYIGQSLLLLKATSEEEIPEKNRGYEISLLKLDYDLESDRESFARSVEAKPITEDEIDKITNPLTGNLILTKKSEQCFVLAGVSKYSYVKTGIDPEMMSSFGVYEYIAKLAAAFHVIKPAHNLLFGVESNHDEPQTYEELLSARISQLKVDMKDLMLKTQVLREDEIDSIIANRYPDIA